jgi:cellulose synthase (UDP-forming)
MRYGFCYLARPGSEFKKAGNLQYAYSRTSGEFILILDADFVPREDFLLESVPYFEQESVGIVQTPQYFSTTGGMSWLERCAGATQELFFRQIQPSRDAAGAAICVGTSAVYRRSALEAIGGFPLIGHSEDVFTGVLLGREGYGVQYVPVVLSRGRCPDQIGAFLAQQYRWCEGSMALISDRRFHEDTSMTGMQRLSFWAGFLYYLSTALMAVLAPLPLLVMVAFFPANINVLNMLPLLGVVLLWLVVLPAVSLARWRVEVLRVQTLYGFAHLFSVMDAARGKVMEWVATGAGSVPRRTVAHRVQRFMVPYLAVTQVLVFAGLLHGAMEFGLVRYSLNIAFAALGAYVFLPVVWLGRGALIPSPRRTSRHTRDRGGQGVRRSHEARVIDLRSPRRSGRHAVDRSRERQEARRA